MVSFNLIEEAVITAPSGYTLTLSGLALSGLSTGSPVSVSGSSLHLLVDFGVRKLSGGITYAFSPVTTTGVQFQVGDEPSTLSSVAITPTSSGFTTSGFSARYVRLDHTFSSGITVSSLNIKSQGDLISVNNPVSDQTPVILYGNTDNDITEVKVYNTSSGSTDLYVTVDAIRTSGIDFNLIEVGTTSTGVSSIVSSDFNFPDVVPFEWGTFSGTTPVLSGVELVRTATFPSGTVTVISGISFMGNTVSVSSQSVMRTVKAKSGVTCICRQRSDGGFDFFDPVKKTKIIGASPSALHGNLTSWDCNRFWDWDGADNIFYYNNHSSPHQLIRYSIQNDSFTVITTISNQNSMGSYPVWVYAPWGSWAVAAGLICKGKWVYLYNMNLASLGGIHWMKYDTTVSGAGLTFLRNCPHGTNSNGGYPKGKGCVVGDYIYLLAFGSCNPGFARFNTVTENWEVLPNPPGTIDFASRELEYDQINNRLLYLAPNANNSLGATLNKTITIYSYDINSGSWSSSPVYNIANGFQDGQTNGNGNVARCGRSFCIAYSGSTLVFSEPAEYSYPEYIDVLPFGSLPEEAGVPASGYWKSPVFVFPENSDPMMVQAVMTDSKGNASSPTFAEVKLSDTSSPSIENYFETFSGALPTEAYFVGNTGSSSVTSANQRLVFDHLYSSGSTAGAYVYAYQPFNCAGKMYYRFFYNPPTSKSAGSLKSYFGLVPYEDPATVYPPNQHPNSDLSRTSTSFLHLKFGSDSDVGSRITNISFYNGSAYVPFPINAFASDEHLVEMFIDWDSGTYKIKFDGSVLGTGTLSLTYIKNQYPTARHTFEIFSCHQGTTFQEIFRAISVVRLGNVVDISSPTAVVSHPDDVVFGSADSGFDFSGITNPAIFNSTYAQYRLWLSGSSVGASPRIVSLKGLRILRYKNVAAGGYISFFVKVPRIVLGSSTKEKQIYFKAWMKADIE